MDEDTCENLRSENRTMTTDVLKIVKENQDRIAHSLETHNEWDIELVAQDGSILTDGFKLILFSPILRTVLMEHQYKHYTPQVILPDFKVKELLLVIDLLTVGYILATEDDLCNISLVIDLLMLDIQPGCYTITQESENGNVVDISTENDVEPEISISTEGSMLSNEISIPTEGSMLSNEISIPTEESASSNENSILDDSFRCPICSVSFGCNENLLMHQDNHCNKHVQCSICQKISESLVDKLNHNCSMDSADSMFTCSVCNKVYGEEYVMLCHKQQHDVSTKLECPICSKNMVSTLMLIKHVKQHTNETNPPTISPLESAEKEVLVKESSRRFLLESLTCRICKETFTSGKEKVDHDCKLNESQESFKCDMCGKVFGEKCVMLVHHQQHSETSRIKCPICFKSIPPILHLIYHVRKHTEEIVLTNVNKNVGVPTKQNSLYARLKAKYRIKTNFQLSCDQCAAKFETKTQLVVHQQIHNGKTERHCPYCSRVFAKKCNTIRHVSISHLAKVKSGLDVQPPVRGGFMRSSKQYSCDSCQMAYNSKIQLLIHQQVHKNKSELQCPICNKKFLRKQMVFLHMRAHLGVNCRNCGSNFSNSFELKQHKKHSCNGSIEEYICKLCQRIFYDDSDFIEHRKLCRSPQSNGTRVEGNDNQTRQSKRTVLQWNEIDNQANDNHSQRPKRTVVKKITQRDTAPKLFPCTTCGIRFCLKARLLQHEQTHNGKSILECPICNKTCLTRGGTVLHIQQNHLGFSCYKCNMTFTSYQYYVAHKKTVCI